MTHPDLDEKDDETPTNISAWCKHLALVVVCSETSTGPRWRERCPACWKGFPYGASGWGREKSVKRFGAIKVDRAWAEDAVIDLEPWERLVAARKWFQEVRYAEHLSSDKWRAIRARAIARAGDVCERCHGPAEHVHHVTYANFGSEKDEDLEVLCAPCHWREHGGLF